MVLGWALLAVVAAACGGTGDSAVFTSLYVDGECSPGRGEDVVRQWLEAVNDGDLDTLRQIHGEDGGWEVSVSLDLYEFARGNRDGGDTNWNRAGDEASLVQYLRPLGLRLTELNSGPEASEVVAPGEPTHLVAGPQIFWAAGGSAVTDAGASEISGGGKSAIYCETATVRRILLGPLDREMAQ